MRPSLAQRPRWAEESPARRDNLNAATEKLWEEKVRTEEELLNISNSYINLTDQLGAERDTAEEADDRVRQSPPLPFLHASRQLRLD